MGDSVQVQSQAREKRASLKKIEANRRNALRSTGPKTLEGKARVRLNALTHGLLSREILLPDDDPDHLSELSEGLRAELEPVGERETLLVDLITRAVWRLRRFGRVEAGIFTSRRSRTLAELIEETQGDGELANFGLAFIRDAAQADAFSKLGRYEANIERSLYRALHELERLQRARLGGTVPPPIAIDVGMSGAPRDTG